MLHIRSLQRRFAFGNGIAGIFYGRSARGGIQFEQRSKAGQHNKTRRKHFLQQGEIFQFRQIELQRTGTFCSHRVQRFQP